MSWQESPLGSQLTVNSDCFILFIREHFADWRCNSCCVFENILKLHFTPTFVLFFYVIFSSNSFNIRSARILKRHFCARAHQGKQKEKKLLSGLQTKVDMIRCPSSLLNSPETCFHPFHGCCVCCCHNNLFCRFLLVHFALG